MATSKEAQADLSVIVVTRDSFEILRPVIRHLRAQTIRDRIELVIVAPSAATLAPDEQDVDGFLRYVVVEVGRITSRGGAAAHGVWRASAPVVAFIENHSFPEPGWAAALVGAHAGPWAGVGPVVRNANPDSIASWSAYFSAYGRWAGEHRPGVSDALPYHNSAYKRALLLEYGDALVPLLESEGTLQADLRRRGHHLYLEPSAVTAHVNWARLARFIRLRFCRGRAFGASRSEGWSSARRFLYVAGGALIPFLNTASLIRTVRRAPEGRRQLPRLLPYLLVSVSAEAVGEVVGYLAGEGDARRVLDEEEFCHYERYGSTAAATS